jgi:hypothetical protein
MEWEKIEEEDAEKVKVWDETKVELLDQEACAYAPNAERKFLITVD